MTARGRGLHCLSAFSAFPTKEGGGSPGTRDWVSIAFRRSVRSRLVLHDLW